MKKKAICLKFSRDSLIDSILGQFILLTYINKDILKYSKQLFQFLIALISLKKQENPLKILKFITLVRIHILKYNKQFLKFFRP